jgi:hypothetical protein
MAGKFALAEHYRADIAAGYFYDALAHTFFKKHSMIGLNSV